MCKFILACLLLLYHTTTLKAVEFTISDPLVTDLEIAVSASLSASTNYYLQGILRSQSSSKYFGETLGQKSTWIDYVSSPDKEYIVSNFFMTDIKESTWSGSLKLRFKLDDPNYLGPGIYDLKVRRFTGGSTSSAGESNTIPINLTVAQPTPIPSPSPSTSPVVTQTPTPSPSPSPVPSQSPKPSPLPSPSILMPIPSEGTVAGSMTAIDLSSYGVSPSPKQILPGDSRKDLTLNHSRAKTVIIIGVGMCLLSFASYMGYQRYSRNRAN